MVQWLGLDAFSAGAMGLIPSRGTKIPQVVGCGQKKEDRQKESNTKFIERNREISRERQTKRVRHRQTKIYRHKERLRGRQTEAETGDKETDREQWSKRGSEKWVPIFLQP